MNSLTIIFPEANLGNLLGAIQYIKFTILLRGTNGYRVIAEGFSHPEGAIMERDFASHVNFADNVAGGVQDGWHDIWKRAWTGLKAADGRLQIQSLMGSIGVVDIPPAVEMHLALRQVRQGIAAN